VRSLVEYKLIPLYIFTVVRGFSVASFMFLYPLYLLSINYSTPDIGLMTTLGSLPIPLIVPLIGYMVDRGWSRELLFLSNFLLGIAFILPVIYPFYPVLALAYTMLYLSMFMWMQSRTKLIAFIVSTSILGRVYAVFSILFNGSRTVTPFILSRLTEPYGYSFLMLVSGSITLALSIAIYLQLLAILHEIKRINTDLRHALKGYISIFSSINHRDLPLILFAGIDGFAWRLWFPLINAYLKQYRGLTDLDLGNYLTILSISMLITAYLAGSITDRIKPLKALIIYELLGVTGVVALQFNEPILYLSPILFGFSIAFWITAYNSLLTILYGYHSIGRIRALTDTMRSTVGIPAPQVGGYLLTINPLLTFILSASLMLSAITPLIMIKKEELT